MDETRAEPRDRRRLLVTGIVQGVGFRPFVHRLALHHGLHGWVRNDAMGVEIDVEGPAGALEALEAALSASPPPAATVRSVRSMRLQPRGAEGFSILSSGAGGERRAMAPPDMATCPACLAELRDPGDRRCGYPFLNCTDCGPRYTIIRDLPYDRPATTMASFRLCDACRAEYEDPGDRRYHAQPTACPACGPRLRLLDAGGRVLAGGPDALEAARGRLRRGGIVAVKGLGGYHLAADPFDETAVQRLRRRKRREEKPLAVMAADLAEARRLARLGPAEERLLVSAEAPIVLARKRPGGGLAPSLAPGNPYLGVLLAYTPLHHLLLAPPLRSLVMTSANLSDEPVLYRDDEARQRLEGVADAFLAHDRPIETRADDSVARVVAGREVLVRRSRGYVPRPVFLPLAGEPVLAAGADLKNTVAVTRGDAAFLGHHIGDLERLEALEAHRASAEHLCRLLGVEPRVVAHDLHPGYASTREAQARPARLRVGVQHHHAHAAAVMAENGLRGRVVAATLDGTGWGTDGTVWGGEFLVADLASFRRAAHLDPVPLPGADAAARQGWRMAVSHLHHALGWTGTERYAERLPSVEASDLSVVLSLVRRRVRSPRTSSLGRLFDAVSALCGVALRSAFEGQAAIELEGMAADGAQEPYPVSHRPEEGRRVISTADIVRGVVGDLDRGSSPAAVSARFHDTVTDVVVRTCADLARREGLDRVVLSGGCFQNARLLGGAVRGLASEGLAVYTHSQVPPNDGGVSLGQAAVALERMERSCVSPCP